MKDPVEWAIAICIILAGIQQCGVPAYRAMVAPEQCTDQTCEAPDDGEERGAIP